MTFHIIRLLTNYYIIALNKSDLIETNYANIYDNVIEYSCFTLYHRLQAYWYFLRLVVELVGGVVAELLPFAPKVDCCPDGRFVHPLQNSMVLRLSNEGNVWPNQRTRLCQIWRYISVLRLLLRTSFNR